MSATRAEAERIIRAHVMWSMGAGLIPLPLFDIAAVTAIQIDMLNQLAALYGVDYSRSTGKTFVGALTGSTFARLGASLIKGIPGIGSVVGGLSMSAMSGASTYAVGQVTSRHLESGGDFMNVDTAWARKQYDVAFREGKDVVSDLEKNKAASKQVFEDLEKLADLRDRGILTPEEFDAKKAQLLDQLGS